MELITEDYWNIDFKQLSLLPKRKRNRIIIKNKDNDIVNQNKASVISTNLESFFRFSKSYIQVFVNEVKENGNDLDDKDDVALINNGLNFFKQIVLKGNGYEISNFLLPGVKCTIKNLISFSHDYSKTIGCNELWYTDTSDKLDNNEFKFALPATPDIEDIQKYLKRNYAYNIGYAIRKQLCEKSNVVEIIIPMMKIFEFFEQDKIYRCIRFEIMFTKNKNENMLCTTAYNKYKVNYLNLDMIVPFYYPNYVKLQYINEVLASNKALNYTWEESIIIKS